MAPTRPLRRDDLQGDGAPIVVAPMSQPHLRAPCHAPVTHDFAALAFCTAGRSRVEQHGRWTLQAGDILLVPAGQPHRSIEPHRVELWGLRLSVACFAAEGASALLEPFERVRDGASAVVHVPSERHAYLEGLLRELQDATGPRRRAEPWEVQRSLLTLVLHEARRASRWDDHAPRRRGVVLDSLRFIERNCLRPLTLGEVARAVGRSPAYVTTALARATGRSAVEWIIAGRMAEARNLLLRSDERVDVVAERVGYADPTHFIRMFRRAHGATPAAWRAARTRGPAPRGPAPREPAPRGPDN